MRKIEVTTAFRRDFKPDLVLIYRFPGQGRCDDGTSLLVDFFPRQCRPVGCQVTFNALFDFFMKACF